MNWIASLKIVTSGDFMRLIYVVAMIAALAGCGESYEDPYGNKITKEEHERRVANDAAHDALINLMSECKARPHNGCPSVQ